MTRPALAQQILRDAETEAFMADMSAPLVKAAGMTPKNVQVLVINDPEINAFVAGGQYVWVHSGLIAQADNVNQLQGVVAHELGHIEGGHIIRSGEGIKDATSVTLLSLVLGAAAIAAGGAEAGMGIMGLGQQAAMRNFEELRQACPTGKTSRDRHMVCLTVPVPPAGDCDVGKRHRQRHHAHRIPLDVESHSSGGNRRYGDVDSRQCQPRGAGPGV